MNIEVDLKNLPKMNEEQINAVSHIPEGMGIECDYTRSQSGYYIWNGNDWIPFEPKKSKIRAFHYIKIFIRRIRNIIVSILNYVKLP